MAKKPKRHSFFYRNSLSITLLVLFILSWAAQSFTGWHEFNQELTEHGAAPVNLPNYFLSGHFIETTFENWESEFLQMFLYILLTVFLRQQGSSESKSLDEPEEVDREPTPSPQAPWPVRKGGFWLLLYKNSLSMAFLVLFLLSFWLHALGSLKDYNLEQRLKHQPTETFSSYMGNSRLWFESFQNWQSEFLSVASIVLLSIFLRQKGSPESKPVDAPNDETGK
jgi:hypothetical protein